MAYNLEHIFDSDGSDLSNALHTTTLSGANHMEYDGKYLWVTCGTNGIAIFEWWGELTDNEPTFEELDETIYEWYGATQYDELVLLGVGETKFLKYPRVSAVIAMDGNTEANVGTAFSINYVTGAVTRIGATPIVLNFTYNYNRDTRTKLRLVTYITVTETQVLRTTCDFALSEPSSTVYSQMTNELAYAKVTARVAAVWPNPTNETLNAFFIKKCGNEMFVTHSATFKTIYRFDIATQNFLSIIDVTEAVDTSLSLVDLAGVTVGANNSNLQCVNSKLWFVGAGFSDAMPQRMYMFDPVANTKTFANITAKPSKARVWIANGNNGFVYCTNPGNVSVSKFNETTGALVSTIRVNAEPSFIFGNPDKRIFVSSYAGMLSLIDWDDDGVHNNWAATSGTGAQDRAVALQVDPSDGSKVWFVDTSNVLARHDLNTFEQLESGDFKAEEKADWEFFHPKLKSPENMWISPVSSFVDGQGASHDLKPYIFLIQDNRLLAWRLENQFYRPVFATINGVAAATNQLEYFGG